MQKYFTNYKKAISSCPSQLPVLRAHYYQNLESSISITPALVNVICWTIKNLGLSKKNSFCQKVCHNNKLYNQTIKCDPQIMQCKENSVFVLLIQMCYIKYYIQVCYTQVLVFRSRGKWKQLRLNSATHEIFDIEEIGQHSRDEYRYHEWYCFDAISHVPISW